MDRVISKRERWTLEHSLRFSVELLTPRRHCTCCANGQIIGSMLVPQTPEQIKGMGVKHAAVRKLVCTGGDRIHSAYGVISVEKLQDAHPQLYSQLMAVMLTGEKV